MSRFTVKSDDLETDALNAEVAKRAGRSVKEPADAPDRRPPPGELFDQLLATLAEHANSAESLPIRGELRPSLAAGKRLFWSVLGPLLKEALGRQRFFNRRVLDALAALRSEQQSLEERLERLEGGPGRGKPDENDPL
jgi:hypothetical protein